MQEGGNAVGSGAKSRAALSFFFFLSAWGQRVAQEATEGHCSLSITDSYPEGLSAKGALVSLRPRRMLGNVLE